MSNISKWGFTCPLCYEYIAKCNHTPADYRNTIVEQKTAIEELKDEIKYYKIVVKTGRVFG